MVRVIKPRVAIAYDFDGTLARGNMQESQFIPDIEMNAKDFWAEVKKVTKDNEGDEILIYMGLMLEKANAKRIRVKKKDLSAKGENIKLFKGVNDWFDRINNYASEQDVIAEHYMISSGNEEIILGTSIAKKFNKIYASKYRYDHNDVPVWPALAVNYTNKTQFLYRINKGALEAHDKEGVNKVVPHKERPVPFQNMIFIGDGETDIPCFNLIKDREGLSIAVYQPRTRKRRLADKLLAEGRVHCVVTADYSKGKELEKTVFAKIDEIATRHALKKRLG